MLANLLATLWARFPLALLLARLVVAPISFMLHELAHGLVATLLGDPTPRESGRLTLNPFRHLEGIGIIGGVLSGVGWSRPTPIRPHRMWLPGAIGGLLAVAAGLLASLGIVLGGQAALTALHLKPTIPWAGWPTAVDFLTVAVRFNLTLALLNLLPLFPLDMYTAIRFLLPLRAAFWWERASGLMTTVLGVGLGLLLMLPAPVLVAALGPPVQAGIHTLLGW